MKTKLWAGLVGLLLVLVAIGSWVLYQHYRIITPVVDITQSEIGWAGKSVSGGHVGKLKFEKVDLQFQDGHLRGGSFVADMGSITVDDIDDPQGVTDFVAHITTEDFFEVNKYPTASFVIIQVEAQNATDYQVTGNMTIKGITKPLQFQAQVSPLDEGYRVSATLPIDRTQFGIEYGANGKRGSAKDWFIYNDFVLTVNVLTAKE
ncbi:MAG: YceI family protein [Cyclobacteriaceae bacterium]|nr:YceI family protein [Cyclobacteriaceae bacterium]